MPNDAPGAHHSPDSPPGSALPTSGAARPADAVLIDKYGRQVTYLRLSITDRCDFRCRYCMAVEMEFLPRAQVLTLEECLRLASAFVELGVSCRAWSQQAADHRWRAARPKKRHLAA